MTLVLVLMGILSVVALWAVSSPHTLWWKLFAWPYRHPEAHEPSDAGYGMIRGIGGLALAVMVVMGCAMLAGG